MNITRGMCRLSLALAIILMPYWAVADDGLSENTSGIYLPSVATAHECQGIRILFDSVGSRTLADANLIFEVRCSGLANLSHWEWIQFTLNDQGWVVRPQDMLAGIGEGFHRIKVHIPTVDYLKSSKNVLTIQSLGVTSGSDASLAQSMGLEFATDAKSVAQQTQVLIDGQWQTPSSTVGQSSNISMALETAELVSVDEKTKIDIGCLYALPTELVFPDRPLKYSIQPDAGENPQVTAARGEQEPIQLVVQAPTESLPNVTLTCSDLKSPDAVLPAKDIDVLTVGYTTMSNGERWPDPLLYQPSDGVTIAQGRQQAWWITVNVPADQKPGRYAGLLCVQSGTRVVKQVPFSIIVADVNLPDDPYPMGVFLGIGANEEAKNTVYRHHFFDRPEGSDSPILHLESDGTVSIDFSSFDKAIELRRAQGMKYIELGFICGNAGSAHYDGLNPKMTIDGAGKQEVVSIDPRKGETEKQRFCSILQQYSDHLQAKGWLADSFIYLWDEPQSQEMADRVNEIAPYFKQAAPKIAILITASPLHRKYSDDIDIYVSLINHMRQDVTTWCREHHKELWIYSCGDLQHPSLTVGKPALDSRVFGWIAYRFDASYVLHWAADVGLYRTQLLPDGLTFSTTYEGGDGCLFYPSSGQDKVAPLPSIRSENLRDGIEDAIILELASKYQPEQVRQAVQQLIPNQFSYEVDPTAYMKLRTRLYEIIAAEQNK